MPFTRAVLSSWIRGRLIVTAKVVPPRRSHGCCINQNRQISSKAGCFEKEKMETLPSPKLLRMMEGISEGKRASLAEAITLVESTHPLKRRAAQWLLSQVISSLDMGREKGKLHPSFRIGLSGPPGAGKSTLIEALGQMLITKGYKVAVLAVDPSSSRSGGSILGDKTRMIRLSRDPNAYIRPSPTSGSLGGVTRSTNEAILLCEGAGYDIIMVETVGVGQSEISVSDMVDAFVLIIPPASGDELQGIKRGIVEVSDVIVINKADGDLLPASRRIKAEYLSAVKFARSKSKHWKTRVMMTSALHNEGVNELWDNLEEFVGTIRGVNEFEAKRQYQQKLWMWNHIDWELVSRFRLEPGMAKHIQDIEDDVEEGKVTPGKAADILLDTFYQIITSRT